MEGNLGVNILITHSNNENNSVNNMRDSIRTSSFKESNSLRMSITYNNKKDDDNNSTMSNSARGSTEFRGSIGSNSGILGNFMKQYGSNEVDFSQEAYQTNPENTDPNLRGSTGFIFNSHSSFRKSGGRDNIEIRDNSTLDKNEFFDKIEEEESAEPQAQVLNCEKFKYVGYVSAEGKRHGFGICYYKNGDKYTGMWQNDKKEGWGKFFIKEKQKIFHAEFKNNTIDGFVEYINKYGVNHKAVMKHFRFVNKEVMIIKHCKYELSGVMEMSSKLNKLVGVAQIQYKNGNFYEGEIVENVENGWGILKRNDDYVFKGQKSDGDFNSYCEIYSPDNSKFYGWFSSNKRHGVGISLTPDGIYGIGKYEDDFKNGGFLTGCNGEAKFELFHCGFLSKTETKKDLILNYTNLVYPEHKWLCKTNNNILAEMLCRVFKED